MVSKMHKEAYLNDLVKVSQHIALRPISGKDANSVSSLSVAKIAEDSPAYAAGFRKNDQVLRINGSPVETMERAINLIHEVKRCDRLTVQVQRDGTIIEYRFDFE